MGAEQHTNTFQVILIRGGGVPGEEVHTGSDHGAAYKAATKALAEHETDRTSTVTEVRMVRTDYWGEAHVSGRLVPRRH